jgi:hypothetical protein
VEGKPGGVSTSAARAAAFRASSLPPPPPNVLPVPVYDLEVSVFCGRGARGASVGGGAVPRTRPGRAKGSEVCDFEQMFPIVKEYLIIFAAQMRFFCLSSLRRKQRDYVLPSPLGIDTSGAGMSQSWSGEIVRRVWFFSSSG